MGQRLRRLAKEGSLPVFLVLSALLSLLSHLHSFAISATFITSTVSITLVSLITSQ